MCPTNYKKEFLSLFLFLPFDRRNIQNFNLLTKHRHHQICSAIFWHLTFLKSYFSQNALTFCKIPSYVFGIESAPFL